MLNHLTSSHLIPYGPAEQQLRSTSSSRQHSDSHNSWTHFFDHLSPDPLTSCRTPPPSLNPSPPHSLPRPTGVRSSPTLSAELDPPPRRLRDKSDSAGCVPGGDCREGDCVRGRGASPAASTAAATAGSGSNDAVGAHLAGLNCGAPGSGGGVPRAKSRTSPVVGLVNAGVAESQKGAQEQRSGLPTDDDCPLERLTLCNDTTPI